MKRIFACLLAVLVLVANPSWAQQAKPTSIKLDPQTGCSTNIGDQTLFAFQVNKPGTFVFLRFKGAVNQQTESDPLQWKNRVPLAGPANGQGYIEFSEYSGDWAVAQISKAGAYLLTFEPRSMHGWRGETSVCMRMNYRL